MDAVGGEMKGVLQRTRKGKNTAHMVHKSYVIMRTVK